MHQTLQNDRLHVAVDLLILTVRQERLNVLLAKRTEEPCAGCWALPGRLLGLEESAESCAESLIKEMLPVKEAYMEQLYTFSTVQRDPRGRVISVAYLVIVPWSRLENLLDQPGMLLHSFVPEEVTGSGELAFDHEQIIQTGIQRLRGKIGYTELGFRFLNCREAFSLGELQNIFEAVSGETMDTSNFRRFILGRYEAAGRIRQTEGAKKQGRGRPAALYCYLP